MPAKRKFNSAAVQELYDEVVGNDPSARDEFERELVNIEVAQWIHDMRTGAGLSPRTLAKKVGTSASAVNRALRASGLTEDARGLAERPKNHRPSFLASFFKGVSPRKHPLVEDARDQNALGIAPIEDDVPSVLHAAEAATNIIADSTCLRVVSKHLATRSEIAKVADCLIDAPGLEGMRADADQVGFSAT